MNGFWLALNKGLAAKTRRVDKAVEIADVCEIRVSIRVKTIVPGERVNERLRFFTSGVFLNTLMLPATKQHFAEEIFENDELYPKLNDRTRV